MPGHRERRTRNAGVVAGALLLVACTPGPNDEARTLANRLEAVAENTELSFAGKDLLYEKTDPGRDGINNAEPPQDSRVFRRWRHSDVPEAVCDRISVQLTEQTTFTVTDNCEPIRRGPERYDLLGHVDCDATADGPAFRAYLHVAVFGPDRDTTDVNGNRLADTVELELTSRYPVDGTPPTLPDDAVPRRCPEA